MPNAAGPVAPRLAMGAARHWAGFLLISAALLIPCFWQPRIQAGDLSSHIYNAWLVQLVEAGRAGGLAVVGQSTNILFDWMLGGLFRLAGPEWAQRLAVAAAVLIFAWGAFAFVCKVSRAAPWYLLPTIAALAYGWVFHMGFFNFYLSLGLAFWALAAGWDLRPRSLAIAAAALALAYTAHALPVVWAAGLLLYSAVARRLAERGRIRLAAGAIGMLLAARLLIAGTLVSTWVPWQLPFAVIFGADQLWVFGPRYLYVAIGQLVLCVSLLVNLPRRPDRKLAAEIPLQLLVITAAAVLIVPTVVLIPGYRHALAYVAERMTLPLGILFCALLGSARPQRLVQWGLAAVALLFFAFLFQDERGLNRLEDRMDEAVAQLPPGQRVFSPITDPEWRVNALSHIVDRSCLERCYSYANYEPSTAQFRVRALAPNGLVVDEYRDSWDLQTGSYVVRERDLPLYCIAADPQGRLQLIAMKAGAVCAVSAWSVFRDSVAEH